MSKIELLFKLSIIEYNISTLWVTIFELQLAERLQDQLNDFYMKRKTGCRSAVWEWIASWKLVWIPNLKQKDINNPWTFISVVAATILMALTIAQTYYAARSYWDSNQKKNLRSWFVWECSINNLIGVPFSVPFFFPFVLNVNGI